MAKSIFQGVNGFSGFFQAFSGEDVTITFVKGNQAAITAAVNKIISAATGATTGELDKGFLVQQYTAQWQRPVSIERVLNRKKPVAMVGAGTGTLTIQGLMGTPEGIEKLLQSDDVCNPLNAIIYGASSFTECDENGGKTKSNKKLIITLSNVIPQAITVTGNAQNQGIMLQTANAQFQFGGFQIG